jgi:histidine triad (HIT) family protein
MKNIFAFRVISPAAPVHILIIPKQHISSALEINSSNSSIVSFIIEAAARIAREEGIAEDGFRIVNNCGKDGGQTVNHLHFHLLGGRKFDMASGLIN